MNKPTHYTAKCAHCRRDLPTPIPIGVTGTFFCSGNRPCITIWRTRNTPPRVRTASDSERVEQ